MAKERIEPSAELIEILAGLKEAEAQKKNVQEYIDQCNAWLADNFSSVDYNSDFEGTSTLYMPTKAEEKEVKISFEYKFNRSVDAKKVPEVCASIGVKPEDAFNFKYDFSNPKMKALDENARNVLLAETVTTKRAKLAVKITYPDGDNATPEDIRNYI